MRRIHDKYVSFTNELLIAICRIGCFDDVRKGQKAWAVVLGADDMHELFGRGERHTDEPFIDLLGKLGAV